MHPLDSAMAEAEWAQHHLNVLRESVKTHYRKEDQQTSATGELVHVRFKIPPIIPWSLMVGDVVHGLRCALDHTAYALAAENLGGGRIPSRSTLFPVFEKPYPKEFKNRTKQIGREAREQIETFQPYDRRNILWLLAELSNADKHRKLSVVPIGVSFPGGGLSVPSGTTVTIGLDGRVFSHDPKTSVATHELVEQRGSFAITVELPDGSDRISLDVLQDLATFVKQEVVPSFMRFFPSTQYTAPVPSNTHLTEPAQTAENTMEQDRRRVGLSDE